MAEELYIGVDGGGTWTRAILSDALGHILAEGRTGSSNRNHHGDDVVVANLRTLLADRLGIADFSQVRCLQFGMSGVSTASDGAGFLELLRAIPEIDRVQRIEIENDAYIGLAGGLAGRPGIFLIAGTGSAVLGRNAGGETHWCGGWGALADDAGSAYALGVEAVRIAVRAQDGRVRPTILRDIVFDFLAIGEEPRRLIDRVHNQDLSRDDLARLAPCVIDAYRQGDWAAVSIVHHAVQELTDCVKAVARTLFAPDEPCEAVLSGGLALSGPPFQPLLTAQIEAACPQVTVVPAALLAVQGAVLEGIARVNGGVSEAVLQNLKRGAPQTP